MTAGSIPQDFYKIGTKQLNIEMTATGNDPGPWNQLAPLTVLAETIDSTWWDWTGTISQPIPWKRGSYGLSGLLTNKGVAKKTPTSVTLLEHDTAVADLSGDRLLPAIFSPTGFNHLGISSTNCSEWA